MGSDTWNKSKKKLGNIKGTKVMFWYKWLEQSSRINHFLRRGPISTTSPAPVGRLASDYVSL